MLPGLDSALRAEAAGTASLTARFRQEDGGKLWHSSAPFLHLRSPAGWLLGCSRGA